MTSATSQDHQQPIVLTDEAGPEMIAEVVVPAAEPLDLGEIRELVGAKNVMGTCSG